MYGAAGQFPGYYFGQFLVLMDRFLAPAELKVEFGLETVILDGPEVIFLEADGPEIGGGVDMAGIIWDGHVGVFRGAFGQPEV
jgi:hypothetical protein